MTLRSGGEARSTGFFKEVNLMGTRSAILLFTTVIPGLAFAGASAFYLLPEWAALDASYRNFQRVASANPTVPALLVAEAAENRHRINCFAEGVGVLLGGVMVAVGVHGLCGLPADRRSVDRQN
jgi:hypothetical protein